MALDVGTCRLTFRLMASVFKPEGRRFYMMQIRLPDGTRPPYKSSRSETKAEAIVMAQEWEVRARKEFTANNATAAKGFLPIIMEAERLALAGSLSASKVEELVRRIHGLADPDAKPVSLSSHWDDVIRRETGVLGDSSINNLTFAKKRWEVGFGKKMLAPLASLRLDDIEAAFPKMCAGLSRGTGNQYREVLLRVLNDAVGRRLIDSNPAKQLKTATRLPGLKEQPRKGIFTPEEIKALLLAADDEWRGMILGGFYTSLRLMDVAKLSSDDIEGGFIHATSKKTSTDTDTPIHPRLLEWIGDRKGPFFPNQKDETNCNVSTRFSALMKKAGISKERVVRTRVYKRSYHSLRHSFATIVANAGIPLDVRMALTGSSDAKVASRYVHVSDEKLLDAIAALPSLDLEEGAA
jgi:integrase